MRGRPRLLAAAVALSIYCETSSIFAQQKPQWMPGQAGLNAGILPSPGFTYANITINYDANTYNNSNGKAVPVTGSYDVWAVENIFFYVFNKKVLEGNLGGMVLFPTPASGSLDADITVTQFPNLGAAAGGSGLADLWLQPFNIGWHLSRADLQLNDGLMIPTGRYSAGASNNVGMGYFGNHLQSGTTAYITKNKATSANLFTDWEVHGSRAGAGNTSKTPGQAFTDEWGLGQVLPIRKNMTQLLQLGVIGYDQWQVTANSGAASVAGVVFPAGSLPYYSVHAVGGQLTYILPVRSLNLFFKYENELSSSAHTLGHTIVFGGSWTLPIPKPPPPK